MKTSLVAMLLGLSAVLYGQTPVGTVQGVVTLSDTQRPARFAKVTLTPVKSSANDSLKTLEKDKGENANLGSVMGALMGGVTLLSAQTDLQGRYHLTEVAPGDYYLLAVVPGYVSPGVTADSGTDMKNAHVVHVDADSTAKGDITLQKGGSVSGRVSYEEGSPVAGALVQLEPLKAEEKKPGEDMDMSKVMASVLSGGLKVATTDDRGVYRLAGLPAGEYRVKAVVSLSGNSAVRGGVINMNAMRGVSRMTVFAPAALHTADARKIVVKLGDDLTNQDVLINLSGTHTVSGHVASAVDHHSLNAGSVSLVDTTDKSVTRNGSVEADGSFSIEYVPSGSYTLTVSDAADTVAGPQHKPSGLLNFQQDKVVRSYDSTSLSEIVADQDLTEINLELKQSDKVKQAPDLNGIFGAAGSLP